MSPKTIHILGVTGSIGESTMDVVLHQPEMFDVCVVSAHNNVALLAERAISLHAKVAVIGDAALLPSLQKLLSGTPIEASSDLIGAIKAHRADMTMSAITGMAGLEPLLAAIEVSASVAIANKEPLVAAGAQVLQAAQDSGCQILPVDSEHNAIYQVFDGAQKQAIEHIVLTASGGAFRDWTIDQMATAKKEQALKHPNWSMGQKITIDSASMMNKALEIIEAAVLFGLRADQIQVLIHPQSIVHGMVAYQDGSVLCQMGASDMRTPIANILAGGARLKTPGEKLSLEAMSHMNFTPVDYQKYPAVQLAYDALAMGQYAQVALNAANEVAVQAFLEDEIGFLDIVKVNQAVMAKAPPSHLSNVSEIIAYDKARRAEAKAYIDKDLAW